MMALEQLSSSDVLAAHPPLRNKSVRWTLALLYEQGKSQTLRQVYSSLIVLHCD